VPLGSAMVLAPTASLAGAAPKMTKRRAALSVATRRDLMKRLKADASPRLSVSPVTIAGLRVTKVVHYRDVPLQALSPRLKGVVAEVPESVLVGAAGTRAAMLGMLPEPALTTDEVHSFVAMLLRHKKIEFERKARGVRERPRDGTHPTHAVRQVGRKRLLTRIRFASFAAVRP
jgi:hypothetical protein